MAAGAYPVYDQASGAIAAASGATPTTATGILAYSFVASAATTLTAVTIPPFPGTEPLDVGSMQFSPEYVAASTLPATPPSLFIASASPDAPQYAFPGYTEQQEYSSNSAPKLANNGGVYFTSDLATFKSVYNNTIGGLAVPDAHIGHSVTSEYVSEPQYLTAIYPNQAALPTTLGSGGGAATGAGAGGRRSMARKLRMA